MNIHNFEQQLNSTIVKRGRTYYTDGHVEQLSYLNNEHWQADVLGSDLYTVDIEIGDDGTIYALDCDCPYDDICKHIVATLYSIRNSWNDTNTPVPQNETTEQLLQKQTKEELIQLILKLGKSHSFLLKEINLMLAPSTNALETAKQVISYHINKATDRKGFIPWKNMPNALKGIDEVQLQIEHYIDNGEHLTAVELSILCFHQAFDLFSYCDDSDGYIEVSIDESIHLLTRAVEEGAEYWKKAEYTKIYKLLIETALNKELNDWSEWRIPLLFACIPLCEDDDIEQHFLKLLQSLQQPKDTWSATYFNKKLLEIHLELTAFKQSPEDIEDFLKQHLDNDMMRERLISLLIEKNDYDNVLHYALEALQLKKHNGNDILWKEFALQAYKHFNDKEKIKQFTYELVMDNQYEYYEELKHLYTAEQWANELELLLNTLQKKNSFLYTRIIEEEQQTNRILDYCRQRPHAIEHYYPYLKEQHYEETCSLFIDVITERAKQASNRSHYKSVCAIITKMKKAGYNIEAENVIETLKRTYYKRPAFLDELQKIM